MLIDKLGCVISEGSSPVGNLGDSAAETSRLWHMCFLLKMAMPGYLNLYAFRTDKGYVRHPNAIWREDDFSSDQALPLWLCYVLADIRFKVEMKNRIKDAGWKTGNGTFVSPGFYGLLVNNQWIINQTLWAQAMIFKCPYRWNDGKKWFEKSERSSADYLNWIHAAYYAYPWVRNLIPKEMLKQKIRDYYSAEPNAFVVPIYDKFIEDCL